MKKVLLHTCTVVMDRWVVQSRRLGALVALTVIALMASPAKAAEPVDLPGLMEAFGWDFDSAVVRAEKVSEGLYLLFGIGGNVAVSIGSQGTLIVDDQFPEIMPKLEKAITNLGGGDVDFALNTHWHFDHAQGNLALGPKGTWIVAHETSRDMMMGNHNVNLVALNYDQKAYPAAALPSITFTDEMQFHFNGQRIELLHFGPAHTTGDTAVYFEGSNAVHLGDVFNRGYPFIDADNGGDLDGMISFCRAVHQRINKDTKVMPGHGDISDREGLLHYIKMLQTVRDRIAVMVVAGASFTEVQATSPTAEFDDEFGDPAMFVDRAYTSLKKKHEAARNAASAVAKAAAEAAAHQAATLKAGGEPK